MPVHSHDYWSGRARDALSGYTESLLRSVAGKLYKPRGQWPSADLIDRCVSTLTNDAVIDRRLQGLDPVARAVLTLMAKSRQPRWKAGGLLELAAALGHAEGMRPVLALMDEGLLYPETGAAGLKGFEQWMCQAGATGYWVFAHPQALARAMDAPLSLPDLRMTPVDAQAGIEPDGLDWLMRLAVVWQLAASTPFRQTQQADFFKRDLERLRADPVLNAPTGTPASIPDPAILATGLARLEGVLANGENELRAGALPSIWEHGVSAAIESLWTSLLQIDTWNSATGARDLRTATNPYPSMYVLTLLALEACPADAWVLASEVEKWVTAHHPYWAEQDAAGADLVVSGFLLGLAPQLRLVDCGAAGAEAVVRLSKLGRDLLAGMPAAVESATHPKTLLVQPNLEIVAYRQGLTPGLVGVLSQFAEWKTVGQACTLQLKPETVYRALESGWTADRILRTLEQCSTRPVPDAVVESLRTWAGKRDRLQVYANAALFEFQTGAQLEAALGRGLPGVRVSDRVLIVPNEDGIDYRHFRLIGTRDYALPPDRCVEIDSDGVTLIVDPVRSDLLLETELRRFASALDGSGINGHRRYRVTPASLSAGREGGITLNHLEAWFESRTGSFLTPAVRLLLIGPSMKPCTFDRPLVLHVETSGIADGLMQWPGTRNLIQSRLGPTALIVAEKHVDALRVQLRDLGLGCDPNHSDDEAANRNPVGKESPKS